MSSEDLFKAKIVHLILSKKPEEALESLSQHYHVAAPKLKVGMPKGRGKNAGCYVASKKAIHVSNRNNLYNPYLIIHEFYHHLRTHDREHKGTERHADKFAKEYVEAYKKVFTSSKENLALLGSRTQMSCGLLEGLSFGESGSD